MLLGSIALSHLIMFVIFVMCLPGNYLPMDIQLTLPRYTAVIVILVAGVLSIAVWSWQLCEIAAEFGVRDSEGGFICWNC